MSATPVSAFDTIISGLAFPEGPRWFDGSLWFSDMHDNRVVRWTPGGEAETVVTLDDCPSGLGFLPDGRLLIAAMHARQVLRLDEGGLVVHADLSDIATWHVNDMLVDPAGRAYVGNFGDGTAPPEPVTPARLAVVGPDGSVGVAASDMELPNGMVLLDGGRTLAVAETRALPPRISAFDVAVDGSLSGRRTLITLASEMPDGMTVDGEDNIWFASPFTGELIRISPQGTVTARIECPRPPYACVLGGPTGETLYVCVSDSWIPEVCREQHTGAILGIEVAGL